MRNVGRLVILLASLSVSASASFVQQTSPATDEIVYVAESGTIYHRANCLTVQGVKLRAVKLTELGAGYEPDAFCKPPLRGKTARQSLASESLAKTSSPAVNAEETVYVTRTGEKYHRAGCRYLARSQIPMKLKEAAVRYGPCSVCRPPVLTATAVLATPVVAAPPPKTSPPYSSPGRCQAITKKGTQCSRTARAGSRYCWQHGG